MIFILGFFTYWKDLFVFVRLVVVGGCKLQVAGCWRLQVVGGYRLLEVTGSLTSNTAEAERVKLIT
ncbi:MAG: hypothetical protein A2275_07770 [Bacteroidetes bacterium RIFOXYA12_FULL_35_11]|nr:MAG: hypothetical protein A2X01_15235 [Bacteroidetes bacterium GWF2_35_48]OFY75066.1 MAG: hypothetical protein A2275_07770 [Bacteroidetes bacterium RIFOXYA12_FULL_35_11]OFY95475.1 MAG: hypothetical protein A2309_04850 [Bacteroidetes bacterium RIFOXYB2_FULL_35_7]